MDLVTELANVSRALDRAGVPYAVCGARHSLSSRAKDCSR